MAANFRMTSTGPGKARLAITGVEIPAKSANVVIAIQRGSDGWYIGSNGAWQNEPGWHRLERDVTRSTAVFLAGPQIVDALVAVAHADSFLVFAGQDGQTRGGLQISQLPGLVGSVAQQDPPTPPSRPTADAPIPPGPSLKPIPPGPGPKPVDPPRKRTPLWWGLAVGIALLVLAVAGARWLTASREDPQHESAAPDVVKEARPQPPSEPQPAVPGPGVTGDQTPAGVPAVPTAFDAPQLKGPAYVKWLVERSPDPAIYQSQAEHRAKQGDCDAVILLYDQAARSSPAAAAQVARLYDPAGFKPSACIGQPNARNAREYYELAAEGGVPKVQQRLDELRMQGQEPLPGRRTWENRR